MNFTRRITWRSERRTKSAKIAPEKYNAEERRYYGHTHTTERVVEQLEDQVYVEIDVDTIVTQLAYKAARNSSGRATALGGRIKAKRTKRTVLTSETKHDPIPAGYVEVTK